MSVVNHTIFVIQIINHYLAKQVLKKESTLSFWLLVERNTNILRHFFGLLYIAYS